MDEKELLNLLELLIKLRDAYEAYANHNLFKLVDGTKFQRDFKAIKQIISLIETVLYS